MLWSTAHGKPQPNSSVLSQNKGAQISMLTTTTTSKCCTCHAHIPTNKIPTHAQQRRCRAIHTSSPQTCMFSWGTAQNPTDNTNSPSVCLLHQKMQLLHVSTVRTVAACETWHHAYNTCLHCMSSLSTPHVQHHHQPDAAVHPA